MNQMLVTSRRPVRRISTWLLRATIVSSALTVMFGSRAFAQTRDTHTGDTAQTWSLRLGLDEVFEKNVQFNDQNNGDLASRLTAGVGRQWILNRGSLRFTGDANQLFYRELRGLNTLSYNVGAGASYVLTRRLSWTISDALSSSYAQDSKVLIDAGLVFPKVMTRINAAATQLSYNLSPRTLVAASLSGQRVSFGSSSLAGASNLTTRVMLTRQLTRSQSVGITWDQTISKGITGDIQGLLGTWQASLGTRFRVSASGGIRAYTLQTKSGYRFAPSGSAGLSARIARISTLNLNYERAVEQAFGFNGVHFAHRVGAGYAVTVGRRLGLDTTFSYGLTTDPLDPNFQLAGRTVGAEVRYVLVKNLGIAAGYAVWMRNETGSATFTSSRGHIAATYGLSWQ